MKIWLLLILPFCVLLMLPSLLDHLDTLQRPVPKAAAPVNHSELEKDTEQNELPESR